MPWHFVTVKVPPDSEIKKVRNWIWQNLESRFAITFTTDDSWTSNYVVGFEDPSEASAFVISLPLMAENERWFY